MRTHGKEFERFYSHAGEHQGIRYVCSRIYSITSVPKVVVDVRAAASAADKILVELRNTLTKVKKRRFGYSCDYIYRESAFEATL